jgi:hypothetical protein
VVNLPLQLIWVCSYLLKETVLSGTEGAENSVADSRVIVTHFESVFVERDCTEHSVADNKVSISYLQALV